MAQALPQTPFRCLSHHPYFKGVWRAGLSPASLCCGVTPQVAVTFPPSDALRISRGRIRTYNLQSREGEPARLALLSS
jgi:hypothetical protein